MIDIDKLRQALGAVQPEEVEELLDRLEAAEAEALEEARLNGMGSEREAALMAKLEAAEEEREMDEERIADLMADLNRVSHENDKLRAKVAEMEKQEPVWFIDERGEPKRYHKSKADYCKYGGLDLLYALPGAQPAPVVPDHKTIRDLLNESGLCAYDREGDLAFMVAATKFAALAAAPKPEESK